MILKREAKDLLGKKVRFLTRGLHTPDDLDCCTGILQEVTNNVAIIKRGSCVYWSRFDDVFTMDEKIPDVVGREEQKAIDEMVIRKYMGEMTDMESLFEFPLLYNLKNDKPREAYRRRVKELADVDLQ